MIHNILRIGRAGSEEHARIEAFMSASEASYVTATWRASAAKSWLTTVFGRGTRMRGAPMRTAASRFGFKYGSPKGNAPTIRVAGIGFFPGTVSKQLGAPEGDWNLANGLRNKRPRRLLAVSKQNLKSARVKFPDPVAKPPISFQSERRNANAPPDAALAFRYHAPPPAGPK